MAGDPVRESWMVMPIVIGRLNPAETEIVLAAESATYDLARVRRDWQRRERHREWRFLAVVTWCAVCGWMLLTGWFGW